MDDAQIERWYPIILGSLAGLVYGFFFRDYYFSISVKDLLSSILSLSGIVIGFLATAASILFSIEKKHIIQQLKGINMYNTLIDYFQSAIAWSFWLALLSCVGLLTDLQTKQDWQPIAFSFWRDCKLVCVKVKG